MTDRVDLPTRPQVQRADEAERVRFSPTSEFRVVCEGGRGLADVYEERSARGDGPPMHRHPWPSWEMVLDGEVRVVVDGEEYTLGAGDLIYIPPNAVHSYTVLSETARAIGINHSDGRFPRMQRKVQPLMTGEGPPDMPKIVAMAAEHGVDVMGPPLTAS